MKKTDGRKVKEWKEKAYPALKKLAEKEGADIYFFDEASLGSHYHSGATWVPIGKTPVMETTGASPRTNSPRVLIPL